MELGSPLCPMDFLTLPLWNGTSSRSWLGVTSGFCCSSFTLAAVLSCGSIQWTNSEKCHTAWLFLVAAEGPHPVKCAAPNSLLMSLRSESKLVKLLFVSFFCSLMSMPKDSCSNTSFLLKILTVSQPPVLTSSLISSLFCSLFFSSFSAAQFTSLFICVPIQSIKPKHLPKSLEEKRILNPSNSLLFFCPHNELLWVPTPSHVTVYYSVTNIFSLELWCT